MGLGKMPLQKYALPKCVFLEVSTKFPRVWKSILPSNIKSSKSCFLNKETLFLPWIELTGNNNAKGLPNV